MTFLELAEKMQKDPVICKAVKIANEIVPRTAKVFKKQEQERWWTAFHAAGKTLSENR